jgi:hypothetical protein
MAPQRGHSLFVLPGALRRLESTSESLRSATLRRSLTLRDHRTVIGRFRIPKSNERVCRALLERIHRDQHGLGARQASWVEYITIVLSPMPSSSRGSGGAQRCDEALPLTRPPDPLGLRALVLR